jgi:hypothetical protein
LRELVSFLFYVGSFGQTIKKAKSLSYNWCKSPQSDPNSDPWEPDFLGSQLGFYFSFHVFAEFFHQVSNENSAEK